jgi:hypothetical protein
VCSFLFVWFFFGGLRYYHTAIADGGGCSQSSPMQTDLIGPLAAHSSSAQSPWSPATTPAAAPRDRVRLVGDFFYLATVVLSFVFVN